jgi:hypothetical protein
MERKKTSELIAEAELRLIESRFGRQAPAHDVK